MPPGITDFACQLHILAVGEFAGQIHLFVDDQGTREIILSVRGIAPAPK